MKHLQKIKVLHKIGFGVIAFILLSSCADNSPLEFKVEKPETVAQQEEIDAYNALKSYINRESNPKFRLGAATSISDYNSMGLVYRLINSNFDEITLGYEMKHGAIVKSDGKLSLDNVNEFLKFTKTAGTTVYGHTLCWHANQNASYLKGLITPLIVTAPAYVNSLNVAGLNNGSLSGWTYTNSGAGISVVDGEGLGGGAKAVKLISSASSSNAEDLQLITPSIPVVSGHTFEVICYIKSNAPGKGRITFEGMKNNTPKIDWMKAGAPSETFSTGLGWKEIRFQISDFDGSAIKLHFDLGYLPDITYSIDVNNLYVYDMQGDPLVNNLVKNGDFESGGGWGGWGNSSTRGITASGLGVGNAGKAFYVTNPSLTSGYWIVQTSYTFPGGPLNNGEKYKLSFWVKGSTSGIIRPEVQSPNYSSDGFGQVYVSTEWKKVELEKTVTATDRGNFVISYGEFAGTVYLDNVVISKAGVTGGGTTVVEKTTAEKANIIASAMESWISGMVSNCKNNVKAWDVVNEPMSDGSPYELKTGVGKTLTADEFYWQDYLGKDYAVKAFKLARKYGNESDLLFINDYNLEYSLDKCKGIVAYVQYIESQGAKVDGIATQMHISIDSDKNRIMEMFKLLAATGKLIKVSELDVSVKTTNATYDVLLKQADMYKYVVDMYNQYVPVVQRYGITAWGLTDSPANSYWLPGEKQGLWNLQYTRKPAYAKFSEGLNGLK